MDVENLIKVAYISGNLAQRTIDGNNTNLTHITADSLRPPPAGMQNIVERYRIGADICLSKPCSSSKVRALSSLSAAGEIGRRGV
jgi:hypothetical protein